MNDLVQSRKRDTKSNGECRLGYPERLEELLQQHFTGMVCVDDASRVAYTEVLPDKKGQTCAEFLKRAADWYRSLGICVERVMTDNGSGYISHAFRNVIAVIGARHSLVNNILVNDN